MAQRTKLTAAAMLCVATSAAAQDSTPLLRGAGIIPARATPDPAYVSDEVFPNSFSHNVLSNGSVVVLHLSGRRVLFLDSTLKTSHVLFDAATPPPNTFPIADARLYRGFADTTYFFDRSARAFRVISPAGVVVRTQPIVDPDNFALILSQAGGGIDGRGRVIMAVPQEKRVATGMPRQLRDSMYLIRVDPSRRGRDTIAMLYNRQGEIRELSPPVDSLGGSRTITRVVPMFDFGDAWAITSRNEIMILRADDYSVNWLGADGKWRQTGRLPWPRMFIPPEAKPRMLEQARAAAARITPPADGRTPASVRTVFQVHDSVGDRIPVFWPLSAAKDADGGFWIHTGAPTMGRSQGLPTFLHVDANGTVIDHVTIPLTKFMQGVTRDGFVLVASTPAGGRYERVIIPPRPR